MPLLIGLALLGAGVVAGYRALQIVSKQLRSEFDRAQERGRQAASKSETEQIKDLGALELDPHSGTYKPKRG